MSDTPANHPVAGEDPTEDTSEKMNPPLGHRASDHTGSVRLLEALHQRHPHEHRTSVTPKRTLLRKTDSVPIERWWATLQEAVPLIETGFPLIETGFP